MSKQKGTRTEKHNIPSHDTKTRLLPHVLPKNKDLFAFVIQSDCIDMDDEYWGFHLDRKLRDIAYLRKLLSYRTITWRDMITMDSCHDMDFQDLDRDFQVKILNKCGDNSPETLYQIRITQRHRVWGYRDNGLFYVMFNDPLHQGYISKGGTKISPKNLLKHLKIYNS